MNDATELARRIESGLPPHALGRPLVVLEQCGSTMDEARERVAAGAPAGLAVLALRQTAGRGRQGRVFVSPPGGLYLTAAIEPPADLSHAWRLGFAAALAAREAIAAAGGPPVDFAWPNDLVLRGRKVGGILAELRSRLGPAGLPIALVGIGLNLGPDPREIDPARAGPAGSIGLPTGLETLATVARALLVSLSARALGVRSVSGWTTLLESIRSVSTARRSAPIRVEEPDGRVVEGLAVGIRDDGALLVRQADGGLTAIRYGERLWG